MAEQAPAPDYSARGTEAGMPQTLVRHEADGSVIITPVITRSLVRVTPAEEATQPGAAEQ